jgi:5'-3' exonuclease
MRRKRQQDLNREIGRPIGRWAVTDFQADVAAQLKANEEEACRSALENDSVRLGEEGWHERYYRTKSGLAGGGSIAKCAQKMCAAYLEGIKWTMGYYYDSVPSWHWFYPFHYAPFATDFAAATDLPAAVKFHKGAPWPPLAQLMAVLPAQSAHCLPQAALQLGLGLGLGLECALPAPGRPAN